MKRRIWQRVVFSAECDEDGMCPVCRVIEFGECPCPGPTMEDEYEYRIGPGGLLQARRRTEDDNERA